MSDSVVITYSGQQVSVPKEVADFLEQDRKREQAQEKQDKRHLSKSAFETVLSGSDCVRRPVEDIRGICRPITDLRRTKGKAG